MEYVFIKYRVNQKDYLVFDCKQHEYELTNEKIRRICRHHFGAGISGFIMGPYMIGDSYYVRMFAPDGAELTECKDMSSVFAMYLRDHGYMKDDMFFINTANGLLAAQINEKSVKVCPTPYLVNQEAAELSATSEEDVTDYAARKIKETGKIITADHFIQWL